MKKAVVFSFVRMNPPTKGHQILVNGMLSLAKLGNADSILFLSQTEGNKDNPIPFKSKKQIVKLAFPEIKVSNELSAYSPYAALMHLHLSGYEQIVFMVGSDRFEQFSNGRFAEWAKSIGIKEFAIVSAGQRDNSRTIRGISATKLRALATKGHKEKFCNNLPDRLNSRMKEKVYQLTVKGLIKPIRCRKANARI